MIYQIESIKTKTGVLPPINRGLIQARHIQARLNNRLTETTPLRRVNFWNPAISAPLPSPVTRWVE